MPATTNQSLGALAVLCALLSEKTRLLIVFLLAKGERNVTSLLEDLELSQSTVSHHLGLLRMNGMVVTNRKGKQVIYSLAENISISGGKLRISLPSATVTVEGL